MVESGMSSVFRELPQPQTRMVASLWQSLYVARVRLDTVATIGPQVVLDFACLITGSPVHLIPCVSDTLTLGDRAIRRER